MIALERQNQKGTTPKMEPENEEKEMTRENENDKHRKIDSENDKGENASGNTSAKLESEDDKKKIIQRWKDLLSSQPKAIIHSTRPPTPSSPFIWFCLSEQQSIREELCREYPNITVSSFACPLRHECVLLKSCGNVSCCIILFS
jgi:hypothetical protein